MQITAIWSGSKPEVEFLCGAHLFFKNRNSYIAAVNSPMSTKFDLLIYFNFTVASMIRKPEVALSGRGLHLGKPI